MIPVRDKKIIIREKLIRFSVYFQKYISSFSRIFLNAKLVAMEFKSRYVTKRVILALKLGSGLSIILIRFSVLGRLSPNRRNITMTRYYSMEATFETFWKGKFTFFDLFGNALYANIIL